MLASAAGRAASAGFSLIELLVVVAVFAILSSMAAPAFTSFIAGQRIKTAAFDLTAALTLARSEAIKRNASAGATVDMAPTGGAWTNGWTVTTGGTVLGREEAQPGINITCVSGGAAVACGTIFYLGTGRLASAAQEIQISSTSTTTVRCITIDLSGQPSSKVGACP